MYEKFYTFKLKSRKIEDLQKEMKNFLNKNLEFHTSTMSTIYFTDKYDIYHLARNQVIISQDEERFFVQIKGDLTEEQGILIWKEIEKYLKESDEKETEKLIDVNMEDMISQIAEREKKIQRSEIEKFVNNFQKKFKRLLNKVEINSVDAEYILTLNEEMLKKEILDVKKPKGRRRRACPKCGNQNVNSIRELEDKTTILSNYPKIYGKKYQCRVCNCEWREH